MLIPTPKEYKEKLFKNIKSIVAENFTNAVENKYINDPCDKNIIFAFGEIIPTDILDSIKSDFEEKGCKISVEILQYETMFTVFEDLDEGM